MFIFTSAELLILKELLVFNLNRIIAYLLNNEDIPVTHKKIFVLTALLCT
jgi:hypothetical protein